MARPERSGHRAPDSDVSEPVLLPALFSDIRATLNVCGSNYLAHGRVDAAVTGIEPCDVEGDWFLGSEEITGLPQIRAYARIWRVRLVT